MIREKESSPVIQKKKLMFIRLVLPAGEAQPIAPLSATLGQVQINSIEFCKNFNILSLEKFEISTLLNVSLFKSDVGYYFEINSIFLPFLLFQVSDNTKAIPLELLYDVYQIRLLSSANLLKSPSFGNAKEFFGSLRAMDFKIIF